MKNRILWIVVGTFMLSGCLVTRNDLKDGGRTQDQTAAMQKAAANDTANRFAEIEASIREMNGRVEVVENKVGQADQSRGRSQLLLEEQLAETNKKVQLLQEEIMKLEGQVQALNEQIASSRVETKAEEKPAGKSEKKTAFDIGEELFEKKDWKKAIVSYQKYRDLFPKGKKIAEATYKIGVCFQELGMKEEAKTFYDEISAKFPNSPEARRAKIRLKKLK
jgi:tetratricopeptide (TPR) repeat protein